MHAYGQQAYFGISTQGVRVCFPYAGALLVDLVQEFMSWADLRFTANVFEAEMPWAGDQPQRQRLAADLVSQFHGELDFVVAILPVA